ncbi:toprim domain-containing protein [Endozoicomonas lisbonensis]|uniref:Toprim domain-containing protein n=1 Tax=Endozoicomonas lisbonensis TaxID=3120522 RepID=A0ABV2SGT2_9GAMM
MPYDRDAEILDALINDQSFKFNQKNKKVLNQGICPDCNRNSVWVKRDKPGRVYCDHQTSCGYTETTKELYPDLFENYSDRCPATPEDPRATARAYLEDRGFNSGIIVDWYDQGCMQCYGLYAPTVRIPLWGNLFEERIIDKKHVQKIGRKSNFSSKEDKTDKHWEPPGFKLEENDSCVITEGAFDAWVFYHLKHFEVADYKAVSSFGSGNLPRNLIKENAGKNILWILAYDNDEAGLKALPGHIRFIEELGERYQVMLCQPGMDWNDVYKKKDEDGHSTLTREYLNDCLWRGRVATSKEVGELAFWKWLKSKSSRLVVEFGDALWRFKMNDKTTEEFKAYHGQDSDSHFWIDPKANVTEAIKVFSGYSGTPAKISPVLPKFLYLEKDSITREQWYVFRTSFSNGSRPELISLTSSDLKSPGAFSEALKANTPGGRFTGDTVDMEILEKRWFDYGISTVRTLSFIGYDRETGIYVFTGEENPNNPNMPKDFGFYNNRMIKANKMGFITAGNLRIKSNKTSLNLCRANGKWTPDWLPLFQKVFTDNGLAAMAWWLGTLFSEQIRNEFKSWPFAEFRGKAGAGKSALLIFLWRLLGRANYEGDSPQSGSDVGSARGMAEAANFPYVLLEGDASKQFNIELLKPLTEGGILRRTGIKNRGTDTDVITFKGGLCFAHNDPIEASEAIMSRLFSLYFTRDHQISGQSDYWFRELMAMQAEDLCAWRDIALSNETTILTKFRNEFARLEVEYKSRDSSMRIRIAEFHAMVAAFANCLPIIFGTRYLTKAVLMRLEEFIWSRAVDREKRLRKDHPLVEQFWEYYEHLNVGHSAGYSQSIQTERLNHSIPDEYIAINLTEFEATCKSARLEGLRMRELKPLLKACQKHPFVATKNVKSKIKPMKPDGTSDTAYCWVFQKKPNKGKKK